MLCQLNKQQWQTGKFALYKFKGKKRKKLLFKKTRPDTRLPKLRAGGQGPFLGHYSIWAGAGVLGKRKKAQESKMRLMDRESGM